MTTELEAVNVLLTSVGESPAAAISELAAPETLTAVQTLREISKEVQTRGWWFNTYYNVSLQPDSQNNVYLPGDTLNAQIDFRPTDAIWPQARGTRVYDAKSNTWSFSAPVPVFKLVRFTSWDELPETAKRYITIKACRIYRTKFFGVASVGAYSPKDESDALAAAMSEDLRNRKLNVFTTDGVIQSHIGRNYAGF